MQWHTAFRLLNSYGLFAVMTTERPEIILEGSAIYRNMMMDIYGLGLVLQKKYRLLRVAYTVFMVGLVIGVLSFILTFYFAAQTGQPLPETTTPIPVLPPSNMAPMP